MVEVGLNPAAMLPADPDPERALATAYAPAAVRPALSALWALDATLARIVATASEPMIGQMRLTWWHDALAALETAPPPAEPVLRALAQAGLGRGLNEVVEGWEEMLDPERDDRARERHADLRGAGLFAAAGRVLGIDGEPLSEAGKGWALVDLARHGEHTALPLAKGPLAATAGYWRRSARPLGMLAKLARRDLAAGAPERQGAPRRLLAMAAHAITGR